MDASQYMTWTSLGTLTGAVVAVVVVGNTARTLLKWDSPFVAFAVSLVIVYGTAYRAGALAAMDDWAIAFLNACLLFCTATGANDAAVAAKPKPAGQAKAYGARPVTWLQPWLTRE